MNNEHQTTCAEQFESAVKGLLVRAPAKINLSLLIAGKRPDGYHEIETIMAKITFYDEILIEPSQKSGIELLCKGPEWAPAGKENLIYSAAQMMLDTCGTAADLKITLTKNIPAGSGLGSASSDAAATLLGLNKYLKLGLSTQELSKLASYLGSDVSFFINGPMALCTGRGEKIKKLDENFNFLAFLLLPDISVSTKRVYANYTHNHSLYKALSERINNHIRENRIDLVVRMCANMLQESSFGLVSDLAELKNKAELLGIGPLCLSGSGAAMFYIFDDNNITTAQVYKHKLKETIDCRSIIVSNNRW